MIVFLSHLHHCDDNRQHKKNVKNIFLITGNLKVFLRTQVTLHSRALVLLELGHSVTEERYNQLLTVKHREGSSFYGIKLHLFFIDL